MKWIGQHIWDLISRFRSDVYLDNPTAGGSDPDKFLGIDSDNKVIYRTGAQVVADIGVPRIYGATTIKVLPSDFLANEDAGVARFTQFADSGTTGLKPGAATLELWAFVDIPEGKKATHIDVYALSNHAISAHEIDINASGISAALGSGTANTQLDITDVNATATNYLGIYVATGSTSDRIYGALVTIADQ